MTGHLLPVRDGWYRWSSDATEGIEVRVRFTQDEECRHQIGELRLVGPITNEVLRSLAIGRIEALADARLGGWKAAHPLPKDVVVRARETVARLRPEEPGGSWAVEPTAVVRRGQSTPITDAAQSGGRGRPDTFYRDIAALYLSLAAETHRPAVALSEARAVPATTAHRWIREARRRGFLPPGRQGKAG